MVEPGTILGGKYRVDRVLGKGGMGVVLAATHVQLGTEVALKFLHPTLVENPRVTERFMREARTSAQLKGEHVCRVFDVTLIDNVPCLVMEKLDGTDLSKLLRREGPLPIHVVADYLLQVCAGMGEAHALGIVHRDLKPGNLFLTQRMDGTPLVKILDFGVAKAFDGEINELTQSEMILGSPSYMSIEQIKSSKLADARSDIWSLGVIIYELTCGKRPFSGEGIANLALNIATEPAPPLPNGPPQLDYVIQRCLAKDPAQRWQNVGELAAALAPFASGDARNLTSSIQRVVRAGTQGGGHPLNQTGPAQAIPQTPHGYSQSMMSQDGRTTPMNIAAPDMTQGDAMASPSTIRAASGVVHASALQPPTRSRFPVGVLAVVVLLAIGVGVGVGTMAKKDDGEPAAAGQPSAKTNDNPASVEMSSTQPAAPATVPAPEPVPAPPPVTPEAAVAGGSGSAGSATAAAEPDATKPDTVTQPAADAPKPVKKAPPKPPKPRKDVGESRI